MPVEARLILRAGQALLVYDFALTFDQEIDLFWRRKVTGATILFLGTRYTAIFSFIFELLSVPHVSDRVRRELLLMFWISDI